MSARVSMPLGGRMLAGSRALVGLHALVGLRALAGRRALERLRALWRGLRTLSGDDAYERYLLHHAQAHPEESALSRRAFFAAEQQRKWSGINRCC